MVSNKQMEIKDLIISLYEIGAFKFGDFKMKVGLNSPVYFDLRVVVSYPKIMDTIAQLLSDYINEKKLAYKHVCGVPYTALPIATLLAVKNSVSMLIRRKETKAYGTRKLIEGIYTTGDTCLIIEDVITSGSSVIETIKDLEREGLVVTDAVIIVDREQGGKENINKHNVTTYSLFTLSFLMTTLQEAGKLKEDIVKSVALYIRDNQIDSSGCSKKDKRLKMSFENRANYAKCDLAKELFVLMSTKKTNLCVAADVTECEKLLDIADICGPYICVLKTHIDILDDFNESFLNNLQSLSKKHKFLIMEDRKFADIGSTVSRQYSNGIYRIAEWADLVTAHTIPGSSILQGLKAGLKDPSKKRGVFLLGEMSSSGNLIDSNYKHLTNMMAIDDANADIVVGVVGQSVDCFDFPGLIQLTPGIKIDESEDKLGQQYNSPEYVVHEKGADICVVGRGIIEAKSIEKAVILYRDRLWSAYCDRLEEN